MNRKQLVVAWFTGILICISLFLKKDIIVVQYDKQLIEKQRIEYMEKVKNNQNLSFADLVYPYKEKKLATNILGIKFLGDHYKYKYQAILCFLIIGGLLIYTLRNKNKIV